MPRKPAITSLLNGQAVYIRFGSTNVTCSFGSVRCNVRAQAAPAKPPPITTTRAETCARQTDGNASDAADAAMPETAPRRVIKASMSVIRNWRGGPCEHVPLGKRDILVSQRHRADAFAGCCKIGIQHRRSRDADG